MATLDLSKPIIWTSKGNVNVSDLEHYVQWIETPEAPGEVTFREVYMLNGEIVREDRHVRKLLIGVEAQVTAAVFGQQEGAPAP